MLRPSDWSSRLILAVVLALPVFAVATRFAPSVALACGDETYSGRGEIKSFGPDRKFVNIAHDKIEGYRRAMTLPFDAKTPEQLAGLNVGDVVTFSFVAKEDGGRVLNSIMKELGRPPSSLVGSR